MTTDQLIINKEEIVVTEAMIEAAYDCLRDLLPLHEGLVGIKDEIKLTLEAGLRELVFHATVEV